MRTKIGTLAECIEIVIVVSPWLKARCYPRVREPAGDAGSSDRAALAAVRCRCGARRAQSGERPKRCPDRAVNIIILDDYQDAVRKLKCAALLEHLNAKVFTN